MKIRPQEINAALVAYFGANEPLSVDQSNRMTRALEASYLVRKARKAAKREKARENGKRLVKGVQELRDAIVNGGEGLTLHTPKPITIEAGKSYRIRDGRKAVVAYADEKWVYGYIETPQSVTRLRWDKFGVFQRPSRYDCGRDDLISEWQE